MELPILRVVGHAVWLVLSRFPTVFRLSWFPIAVYVAASYGLAGLVVFDRTYHFIDSVAVVDAVAAATFLDLILQGLAVSIVAVGIHKLVFFGEARDGVYFAFPFGRTEFLYVLMGAFSCILIWLPAFLGIALYWYVNVPEGEAAQLTSESMVAAGTIVLVVGVLFAIWISYRLLMWPPAVVANHRLSFLHAWKLTKGRVFEMIGLVIASSLLYIAIGAVLISAFYKFAQIDFFHMLKSIEFESKVAAVENATVHPDSVLLEFSLYFLSSTYAVAILSFAYKALRGYEMDRPITDQDLLEDVPAFGQGHLS